MSMSQGTKYAKYPVVGYWNNVPVRLIPDELIFEDDWQDEDVDIYEPPFEGMSGDAATLGKALMDCEAAGLGRSGQLRVRKANAVPGLSAGSGSPPA
jgi:hypothetical protein